MISQKSFNKVVNQIMVSYIFSFDFRGIIQTKFFYKMKISDV